MSIGAAGPAIVRASREPSFEKASPAAISAGRDGPGVELPVARSTRASSLRPATFQIRAAVLPCSSILSPDSSASSRAATTSIGPGVPSASRRMRAKADTVAVAVGGEVDRPSVGGEGGRAEAAGPLVGGERPLGAAAEVDEGEVVVPALGEAADHGEAAVAADVDEPPDAADVGDEPPIAAVGADEVGVHARRGPSVRRDQQRTAVVGPAAEVVGRLAAVGEPPEVGPVGADGIDLRVHPAAGGQGEGQAIAGRRPPDGADRVVERGHRLGPAPFGGHDPDLGQAAEVGDERNPTAVRRETGGRARAHLRHPGHHRPGIVGRPAEGRGDADAMITRPSPGAILNIVIPLIDRCLMASSPCGTSPQEWQATRSTD